MPPPASAQDTTAPAFESAAANGTSLVITFDEDLAAAASLATSAFTVKKTPSGGVEAAVALSTTIAPVISGKTVTLILATALVSTDTAVKVSYTQPATGTNNKLVDAASNATATFTDQPVTNNTGASDTPRLVFSLLEESDRTLLENGDENEHSLLVLRSDGPVDEEQRVTLTFGGTATKGEDYRTGSTLSISVGGISVGRNLTPLDDDLVEGDETIEITAWHDGRDIGTETITIIDDESMDATPPTVANAIPDQTATAGTAFSYAFPANTFSDADSDTLSYTATKADGTALPTWLSFTASTRAFSGTPQAADTGTVSVKVTASDGNGGSVSDEFDITVSAVADTTAPVFESAAANGASLVITFDEALDGASIPAPGDFAVTADGSTVTVTGVGVAGSAVTLTLATAVEANQAVTLAYAPGTNPIQDAAGNGAAPLPAQTVTNNTGRADVTPPTLTGATVNGSTLVLTYDEALDGASVPAAGDFAVTADGSTINVTGVRVAGSTVTLTLATAVEANQAVALDYTPGATPTQDVAGNDAAALSGQAVTNNTGRPPPPPPPPPPPVNTAPLAVDDAAETAEDTPVTIAVLENDSDADGDTLTVLEVSAPAHGTARLTTAGAVEYTPEPDFSGADRFTYVVDDGTGETAQAAVDVTVLPVNDVPRALDDAAETAEDTPVTIAVLENDSDADGDVLAVVEVSVPAHGAARLTAAGAVEYTPEPDFSGGDRFTYVVGDESGLTARAAVDVTVLPVNDPPRAAGIIPDQRLYVGDEPASLDLRPFFEDRDGDPLSYTAVASDPAVAVRLTDATLTLTAARPGAATVTVTAQDPGGLTATQAFLVTTADRQARGVVEDTLAALGRGHLASARATLGRRVETTGQEPSHVTVAGLHVPLGAGARGVAAAGQAVAERWITGLAGGMPLQTGGWTGTGAGAEAVGAPGALGSPAATLGMADGAPVGAAGVSPFGGGGQTDFLLTFGTGQAGDGAAQGQRWTVWGQSDLQSFAGEPSPTARYDGDLWTTYVGVDARLSERWLAGVAVSRSRGNGDWNVGSSTGRLTTTLTSVQPYLRWSDGGTTIWATGGGGPGTARNALYGLQEESDLGLRLGLVEVRRRLATVGGGVELQLRGDASWARLTTAAGDGLIDALEVEVRQLRVGIDVSRPVRTAGGTLVEPFGEVHARHDGGSGQTGAGLEVAGGLRVARGVFRVEGMGRLLALHAADGYRERGAAVTLSVGDGARQPGLTLSLSPRWGAQATASDALWQDQLFHQRTAGAPGARRDDRALDTRVDYGLQLPAGGLLTPFGIYGQTPYGRRLQVGLLLSRVGPVGLEVSGERSALRHSGRDDYRISALGSITFGGAGHASASLSAGQEAHRPRARDHTPRHR